MVRPGLRRGRRARRPRPALGGLRRLSLVPRDGPRVVRGPRDGGAAQRARGRDQGGPGGAARRRRGLHDRDPGHDRAGRLADDRVHDAGQGAVLLRHLLSQGLLPAAGPERLAGLAHPARRRDRPGQAGRRRPSRERGGHRPRAACCRRPVLGGRADRGSARPRTRRCRRSTATTTRSTAGFGGAPKFPPSMVLEFLLRHHQRTGSAAALRMAEGTCEAMARGGMYDQLGGGFARYSVDAGWVVPHFEKMLYDNALLARVYANLWRRTGSELARRVAEETCDWMLRELRTGEGGLAASLDADSEGEEGRFYVWRPAELHAVLGPEDGEFAARVFGVTESGTFEHGASVLQRRRRSRRRGPPCPGPGRAAGRARRPGPPRPGRQGGGRVERAGHLRAGRMRAAVRPAGLHRGRTRRRRRCWPRSTWPADGSSAPRGTGPPGAPRGRSRITPAPPRDSSRCPG